MQIYVEFQTLFFSCKLSLLCMCRMCSNVEFDQIRLKCRYVEQSFKLYSPIHQIHNQGRRERSTLLSLRIDWLNRPRTQLLCVRALVKTLFDWLITRKYDFDWLNMNYSKTHEQYNFASYFGLYTLLVARLLVPTKIDKEIVLS